MSNTPDSKLVSCTIWSPNCGNYIDGNRVENRLHAIDTITIHHMAGNFTVEAVGNQFAKTVRQASSTYGVGTDGRVAQYVPEAIRPWTSGSASNDNRAITIEVANDKGAPDWHVSDEALESLIKLCVDICQRNNIKALNYTGDTRGNLTKHCWFQATNCPGPYLGGKFPYIAEEVNRRLNGGHPTPKPIVNNVDVIYSVYTDKWLDPVVNYNNSDYNGYAGWDGKPITGIRCNLSNGSIKYRAHIKGGNWLDWVVDKDPTQGGYAGIYGKPIDGIQMCLVNLPNYHVEYRTRLKNGEYLSWVNNYGEGDEGYSGWYGKELDRLQIRIIKDYDIEDSKPTTVDEPISTPIEETVPSNNDVQDNTQEQDNQPIDESKPTYKSFDGLTLEEKIEEVKRYLAEYDANTQQSTYSIDPKADINEDGKISALDLIELEKQYTLENPSVETDENSIKPETDSTEITAEPVENDSSSGTDNKSIWVRLIKAIVNLFKTIFGKKKD